MKIVQVISGGQTGADRAALDAAIACGVPHGGWCPKGRRAEDEPIPALYQLTETDSVEYPSRTRLNVEAADLTLIFTLGALTGGSLLTLEFAKAEGKPCVHLDLVEQGDFFHLSRLPGATGEVELAGGKRALRSLFRQFEKTGHSIPRRGKLVLNIAGPRGSSNPAIYDAVYLAVCAILCELNS